MPGKKVKNSKAKKPAVKSVAKPAAKAAAPRKSAARAKSPAPSKTHITRPAAVAAAKPAAPSRARKAEEPELRTVRQSVPVRDHAMPTQIRVLTPVNNESGDDADMGDGNLLAGPRNVQPYIAKRGEQYMSKEQLDHFREILQSWKQDLMVEVDRTVSHMKDEAANFPDPNDRATQEEEFSLELRTRDRERKLIRKIDEALKRIEDGSYGYCLETGEEIGIKRLEARPVATLSLEAQERRERRERQYGDRDDRYR